jgi:hypothetical protein
MCSEKNRTRAQPNIGKNCRHIHSCSVKNALAKAAKNKFRKLHTILVTHYRFHDEVTDLNHLQEEFYYFLRHDHHNLLFKKALFVNILLKF